MELKPLKPYLLFDAGGTLVFPELEWMVGVAADAGFRVTPEQLFETHCRLIYKIDKVACQTNHLSDPFPDGYPRALFSDLVQEPKILDEIVTKLKARNDLKNLWTSTYPWVGETLTKLSDMGYTMSVISNADGRVEQILKDVNLRQYFEKIFDSTIVGFSKPDKRIFEIALKTLDLQPPQALYIGDVYTYDVWGANSAGLGCIQLDPLGLYDGWPGIRLPSVAELPEWLSAYPKIPENYNLRPTKEMFLTFENQTTT